MIFIGWILDGFELVEIFYGFLESFHLEIGNNWVMISDGIFVYRE
jgi:hypothetical protein